MSVYRPKGSRYYQYDFQIDRYRFSGTTKRDNECDAQAVEDAEKAKARRLVDEIRAASSAPLTLGRACDRWWEEVGQHGSERDLLHSLEFIKTTIGPRTPLHAVTDDMVSRLVEARRRCRVRAGRVTEPNGKITQLWRPISNRRVNYTTISLLSRVMHRARDNWNATIIREPKWKKHWLKETKRAVREITPAEERRLDAVESADYVALRRFAIITGLRRRNLILTWSQVDFDEAVVRVVTKGGVPRVLPLSKEAYAILWSRRGHHPEFVFTFVAQRTRKCPKTKDPKTGEPFQFVKGQRYPITYYGMGSNKRSWKKKAGVDARIHDMRHTTGSRTLRATGNLRSTQVLLGHTDVAITAKFYTHVLLEDVRAAMETTAAATPQPKPAEKRAAENDD
ncbi:MAG: site-specific integrase [Rhizobiales bacterium]|nr:site-specific integrase [Hyphomicrobiales bacterium]